MAKKDVADRLFDMTLGGVFYKETKRSDGTVHHNAYRKDGGSKMSWNSKDGNYAGGGHSRIGKTKNKKW